jgi:hypothetical protein
MWCDGADRFPGATDRLLAGEPQALAKAGDPTFFQLPLASAAPLEFDLCSATCEKQPRSMSGLRRSSRVKGR